MSDATENAVVETEVAPLVGVYRHDVHKARLRSHGDAEGWVVVCG